MNKFKLIDSLVAYVKGNLVYLCPQSEETDMKKLAEKRKLAKILVQDSGLQFKIDSGLGLSVHIKNDWYHIENLEPSALFSILSQNTCVNTEFSKKFEIGIDNRGLVFPVTEDMMEYEEFSNETIRSLNYTVKKKVKKFIPGHRYDGLDETFFCLGEFNSHKGCGNSEWLSDIFLQKAYLVCTNIKGCKTLSEVLSTKKLGKEIKILYDKGKGQFVDSGEKLKIDITGKIEERYISRMLSSTDNLKDKLDLLSLNEIRASEFDVENLAEEITNIGQRNLLIYKETNCVLPEIYEINSKKTIEENTASLEYLIYRDINDPNALASSYYTSLFFSYNIDIKEKIKSTINIYDPKAETFNSFESYIKNSHDYLRYRNLSSILILNQRKNTYYSYNNSKSAVTIDTILHGYKELGNTIRELANEALKLDGGDINSYMTVNIGTEKSPLEYVSLKIDINDIVKFKKGISNISENLKNEIMISNFQSIQLEVDKGAEVL